MSDSTSAPREAVEALEALQARSHRVAPRGVLYGFTGRLGRHADLDCPVDFPKRTGPAYVGKAELYARVTGSKAATYRWETSSGGVVTLHGTEHWDADSGTTTYTTASGERFEHTK